MKVTGIETLVLDNLPSRGGGYPGGRRFLFIKLLTDEGVVGLGERVSGGVTDLAPQIALLQHLAEQFVVGQSPFDIERIWQRMFATPHDYRHPGMDRTPAISAIEMALWDIVGKATNQPIYNLLGGRYHDRLRAYAYMPSAGIREDPPKAGEVARRLVAEGFTACKLDPFPVFPLPRDIPLKELRARPTSSGTCARPSATSSRSASARTASSARRARSGRRRCSRSTSRCGSRSRCRRRCPRRWPASRRRRASPSPRASGWPPSTSSRRCSRSRPPGSSRSTSGSAAGSWRRRRSRPSPRPTTR